jgi:hypothetical protein
LSVWDRKTGQAVYREHGREDEVRKISLPNGNYVISVSNVPPQYALAISTRDFDYKKVETLGPDDLSCSSDRTVKVGAPFLVTCTLRNPGDLEIHALHANVGFSAGFTTCGIDFDLAPAHGTRTKSCTITATSTPPIPELCYRLSPYEIYSHQVSNSDFLPSGCFPITVTGGAIYGKVAQQGSLIPLGGVLVVVNGPRPRTVRTGANGEFMVNELEPGTGPYTVTPSLAGYTFSPPFAIIPTLPSAAVAPLGFVAQRTGSATNARKGNIQGVSEAPIGLTVATTHDGAATIPRLRPSRSVMTLLRHPRY